MLLLASSLAAIACWTTASANAADYSGPAYQILPPGDGGFTPFKPGTFENCCEQALMYDALTPKQGNVTAADLEKYFVSEKFGVTGSVTRVEKPEPGLEIKRDVFGIPHVYGETRAEVMFGSGWIAAEDRGVLLALGLGPAYAAADGAPGINAFELLLTGRSFTPSAQSVEFVNAQKKPLLEKGATGAQVLKDLESWAEGVNAYEATLGPERLLPPVSATDAIAGFSFIGAIFGNGGGNEVRDSEFLAALQAKLGAAEGLKVFRDLREVNDPEAPTTAAKPFPYDLVPKGPTPGAAIVDPGSASAAAVHAASALQASRQKMSNFLLAGPKDSADGHPLAVMGPQLGYFFPEIVQQAELQGGGISAQGVITPVSPYVFIGRGSDFAWSLTSAGSENVQQFLEELCSPDKSPPTLASTHYMYKGKCIPFNEFDAGKLGPSESEPGGREVTFLESVHGPISGTVTVKGKPYAISNDRSTRGREPVSAITFSDFDTAKVVHDPASFFHAANQLETTFNIPYVDNTRIAYFSAGRLPVLAAGTDPSLPTLGIGPYDWKGFLDEGHHPHEEMPKGETFLNWNNKPAPEWGAASDNFSYGAVHRVQLYTGFKTGMHEADDASIMNRAATQDLRAVKVWPVIKQVLAGEPAPTMRAQEAAELVSKWAESGASRYGVERPENPGAAVLDAAWNGIATAVLEPVLGPGLTEQFAQMNGPDDSPSPHGSAYDSGWYGYVYKDLHSELGLPVQGAFSRRYCGNGSLSACRASLWAAIQAAAEALEKSQGSNPSEWRAAKVRIDFPPNSKFPITMAWTNRSTFQQVIEFTGHE